MRITVISIKAVGRVGSEPNVSPVDCQRSWNEANESSERKSIARSKGYERPLRMRRDLPAVQQQLYTLHSSLITLCDNRGLSLLSHRNTSPQSHNKNNKPKHYNHFWRSQKYHVRHSRTYHIRIKRIYHVAKQYIILLRSKRQFLNM